MPDFGIAHLPARQANVGPISYQRRAWAFRHDPIKVGRPGLGHGIAFGFGIDAPTIEDAKDDGFRSFHLGTDLWFFYEVLLPLCAQDEKWMLRRFKTASRATRVNVTPTVDSY